MFDRTYTNVALQKVATSSSVFPGHTPGAALDGVIDFDNVNPGNDIDLFASGHPGATTGAEWWEVDLGGVVRGAALAVL